ncbi:MAG TPA: SCO family protein [Candidatus Saccharimonadales bacterium]|jgi:protein SCO1/2|nr:SCO family protein [Candidatus Saccharimonadales bacterium]
MLSKSWVRPVKFSALLLAAMAAAAFMPFLRAGAAAATAESSHFPNIELITQDGRKVHFYDDLIKGKIVAIDMIYTNCEYACPLETARMAQVQKKLGARVGSDIFFYSISIDPEHDTPAALKTYMEKFRVGPGWTFLTGKKSDIDFLSKQLGLYSGPSINKDGHLPHLLIGNESTGQWIRGSALDNPSFQARMIGDFLDNFKHSKLTEQASQGDGQPLQNFDPGKYLFGRQCLACHTIGHGDGIGPDLLGVTQVRSREWLLRMIQRPEVMLDGKDPIAAALLKKYKGVRMSNTSVGDLDAGYILSYIEEQTAAHAKQTGAGPTKPGN